MARQHGIARVTTRHPAMPGLEVLIVQQDSKGEPDMGCILFSGTLDGGGSWQERYTNLDEDTLVVLILRDKVKNLVVCRVPLRAINPMECFMTEPPKLTHDEIHKRFMNAHQRMKRSGVGIPDPDTVARAANRY